MINLLDPDPGQIDIFDIAVSLHRQPRYYGQTVTPISILAHSLLYVGAVKHHIDCHTNSEQEDLVFMLLAALIHDAAEAYTGDINGMIKPYLLLNVPDGHGNDELAIPFSEYEERIMSSVIEGLGRSHGWTNYHKGAINQMLRQLASKDSCRPMYQLHSLVQNEEMRMLLHRSHDSALYDIPITSDTMFSHEQPIDEPCSHAHLMCTLNTVASTFDATLNAGVNEFVALFASLSYMARSES